GQTTPLASAAPSSGGAHPQLPSYWTFLRTVDDGFKLYLFRSFFGQFGWLEYSIPYYWLDCVRMVWTLVEVGFVAALLVRIARLPGSSWLAMRGFLFCAGTALFALGFILFVEHRFRLMGIWGV